MLLVSQQQWVTVCVSLVESCQEDKPSDVNMKMFTYIHELTGDTF